MPEAHRTCPKCGYQRQPKDQGPDSECPRCGLIYTKFRPPRPKEPARDDPPGKAAARPVWKRTVWDRALWIKASIPVGLLVIGCALWIWFGSPNPDASQKTALLDIKKGHPAYPMSGTTWKGTLRDTYPASGDMAPYQADYEAVVVVAEGQRLKEVRWTDSHSPLTRVTVIWNMGNVMVVGEEREGGTPAKMLEPMSERLKVQRSQTGLAISYNRPRELEMEVGFPDTPVPNAAPGGDGPQQSAPGSMVMNIPVRLLPEGAWTVPAKQISRFAVSPQRVFSQCRCPGWNPLARAKVGRNAASLSPAYFEDCTIKDLTAFSCGSSGLSFTFDLSRVAISSDSLSGRNGQVVSPETVRLGGESTMELRSKAFERTVLIRLERDGRGTLEVKDRTLHPSGKAMVFSLEKAQ